MQCSFCRKPFEPVRQWQLFCSTKCRSDFHRGVGQAKTSSLREELALAHAEIASLRKDIQRLEKELHDGR